MGEWEAVDAALGNLELLQVRGGVILVDGRVEAFSLGELLNRETAVIHVEKANPEIRGLFSLINQQTAQNLWSGVPFINREQDLGDPGLRTAKLSYHPRHLVEKFGFVSPEDVIPIRNQKTLNWRGEPCVRPPIRANTRFAPTKPMYV